MWFWVMFLHLSFKASTAQVLAARGGWKAASRNAVIGVEAEGRMRGRTSNAQETLGRNPVVSLILGKETMSVHKLKEVSASSLFEIDVSGTSPVVSKA